MSALAACAIAALLGVSAGAGVAAAETTRFATDAAGNATGRPTRRGFRIVAG